MSLYPEGSTDGALRLGNIVPDFSCDTTHGKWDSFLEWKKVGIIREYVAVRYLRGYLLLTSILAPTTLLLCVG